MFATWAERHAVAGLGGGLDVSSQRRVWHTHEDQGHVVSPPQSHQDQLRAAIAGLSKVHYDSKDLKYSGDEDKNFTEKFSYFRLACRMQQIPDSWRPQCFPVMRRGRALLFFTEKILPDQRDRPDSLKRLADRLRDEFLDESALCRFKQGFAKLTYKKICESTGTEGRATLLNQP